MRGPSPRWEDPRTVAGFTFSPPNLALLAFAKRFVDPARRALCLDIGCGAARNAIPLASLGLRVVGTDLSAPMLAAALARIRAAPDPLAIGLVHAPMRPLPIRDAVFDLVVAHGVWNLARSGAEFRASVAEAARVARPGARCRSGPTISRASPPGADHPRRAQRDHGTLGEATKELMLDFYRRLWVEKRPKHQALWEAKTMLREARRTSAAPSSTRRAIGLRGC